MVKTARIIQGSVVIGIGSGIISTPLSLLTALGCLLTAKITNTVAPTLPCTFFVEVSNDNINSYKTYSRQEAGVAANGVYEFTVDLPPATMYVRTRFAFAGTGGATVECLAHEITSIV